MARCRSSLTAGKTQPDPVEQRRRTVIILIHAGYQSRPKVMVDHNVPPPRTNREWCASWRLLSLPIDGLPYATRALNSGEDPGRSVGDVALDLTDRFSKQDGQPPFGAKRFRKHPGQNF
jgi:hypothetical protein